MSPTRSAPTSRGCTWRVTIDFDGDPLVATTARIEVECELADGRSADELLRIARQRCTVANSLRKGVDVVFQ